MLSSRPRKHKLIGHAPACRRAFNGQDHRVAGLDQLAEFLASRGYLAERAVALSLSCEADVRQSEFITGLFQRHGDIVLAETRAGDFQEFAPLGRRRKFNRADCRVAYTQM